MKKICVLCFAVLLLALTACNSASPEIKPAVGAGNDSGKNDTSEALYCVSTADDNESHDYSFPEPPEIITDQIREDAAKTYLETDKTSYSADDVLRLRIVVAREDTFLGYGRYFDLQGWDEEAGEWVSAFDGSVAFFDDYAVSMGTSSESIRLSDYPIKDYPKYRIEKEVNVDTIAVTAYSNEFTVE